MPERLGHYRLLRELGRGGMGEVYLAEDETLGREVALKVLPARLTEDAARLARFEREARAAAALNHPNVVTVYSLEEADGVRFLTMEHLAGRPLSAVALDGPVSVPRLVSIGRQLAGALAATHEAGILHRDLKPANIMLDEEDFVKVLDFGIARFTGAPLETSTGSDTTTQASVLTQDGAVMGTPGYMSPEQVRGEAVDASSDVFSLGLILYLLASGRPPFGALRKGEWMAAVLRDSPEPLGALRPDLPPGLIAVIDRCLQKAPRARYPSAVELAAALDAPGTASSTPAPRVTRGKLPSARDEFVGREQELVDLEEQLRGGARLVTILGPGGAGKTRLALQHGRAHAGDWPGGVWFCDLTEARSAHGIAGVVASTLGTAGAADDQVLALGHAVANLGQCLLLLDNFEQVAQHAEATVGRWLDLAPEARFVVTSRVALRLVGEHAIRLGSLPVEEDGVRLFEVRARARLAGFALQDAQRECVGEIVGLLDSLPLAIELAAARVGVLSVEQIRSRLQDRFRLLVGGRRGTHHETLEMAINWSWDLLESWEQAALAQASVFRGGFSLDAAEAVLDLSQWDDAPEPLDVLHSLVDRSLLTSWAPPRLGGSERYFDMLVSIQEFAAKKQATMQEQCSESPEDRHARFFSGYAADGKVGESDHERLQQTRMLARENMLAALRHLLATGDLALAVDLYSATYLAVWRQGPVAEAVELGRELLARDELLPLQRALISYYLGELLWRFSRFEESVTVLEAGLELAEQEGDQLRARHLRKGLGIAYVIAGDLERGVAMLETSLALLSSIPGEEHYSAQIRSVLGHALLEWGRYDEARAHFEAALATERSCIQLCNIGRLEWRCGRISLGRTYLEEAVEQARSLGFAATECHALLDLGGGYLTQGCLAEARLHLEAAHAIAERLGDQEQKPALQRFRGDLELAAGNLDLAEQHHAQALASFRAVGPRRMEGWALVDLAVTLFHQERIEDAGEHLSQAHDIAVDLGDEILLARVRCEQARVAERSGRLEEALSLFDQGLAQLRNPINRALFTARRGLCELRAGDREAARRSLRAATELAVHLDLGPQSEVRRAIGGLVEELEGV